MTADIEKIRKGRLFKNLPQRAFDRILPLLKVRFYENCEDILQLGKDSEFESSFGYVISGRVLFLSPDSKPLGVAIKDEFFLGRSFSLADTTVDRLMSASDNTFVVFIPKNVISLLSSASNQIAEMLEEIYDSIFERSKLIAQDATAAKTIQDWILNQDGQKTLTSWMGVIEKKRLQGIERRLKEERLRTTTRILWALAGIFILFFSVESFARLWKPEMGFIESTIPYFVMDRFEPGTRWNIFLGILGYAFLILTMGHSFVKLAIRKFHWKLNFQLSQQIHILFGIIGSYLIVLHTAFHIQGVNIAHWALYATLIGVFSGFIGQFISSQIPMSIRGEKLKLDSLKAEQQKLQQKAELLLNNQQIYKTSVLLISKGVSSSFWGNLLQTPLLFLRARKVKRALQNLGLGASGAGVAAHLIRREYQMKQKIRFLEISNVALKKWLLIHKPIGYLTYGLGALHIILVTWLA